MGLGTMTEEFCAAMQPERAIILDCMTGRPLCADRIANAAVVDARYWRSSVLDHLAGAEVVVAFETFYDETLPAALRRNVKTVLFPMFEWTPRSHYNTCSLLLPLSETDRVECAANRSNWQAADWPASPAVRQFCVACNGSGKGINLGGGAFACDDCCGSGLARKVNWPPKVFAHNAGNASHNRDGTLQVLQAAEALAGTGARLRVRGSFNVAQRFAVRCGPHVEFLGRADDRRELLDGVDCLVVPRRLGGHSLPINEAAGEGVPTIVLDLPDWRAWPYRVPAVPDGLFTFSRGPHPAHRADVGALGGLMQAMALGKIERLPGPRMPTWAEFAAQWDGWMSKMGVAGG